MELLSQSMLKRRFPWLNVDDIALGSLGTENEGSFDPWALLQMLKIKCQDLGVTFVHGDVYNFSHDITKGRKATKSPIRLAAIFCGLYRGSSISHPSMLC